MSAAPAQPPRGSALETFRVALWLGCTAFGGPIAHLGYFRYAYVEQRRWLSAEQYGGIVALCQMLPGPTSSQVGFLVGLIRAGWPGAAAAWLGFTLPSATLMFLFARFAPALHGPHLDLVLRGLKLAAVAVVAQAVLMMWRSLCPSWRHSTVAAVAGAVALLFAGAWTQLLVIVLGGLAGALFLRGRQAPVQLPEQGDMRVGWSALALFLALLAALPLLALRAGHRPVALADIFFRAGASVFGGGHVVLPLLHAMLVPAGWVTDDQFLAGYGLAQALPGPLFTLAAYLGAAAAPAPVALGWALVGLVAIFLPGLLLALAGMSLLAPFLQRPSTQAVLGGVNAAVVGILAAALCHPVWTSAVHRWPDALIAVAAFLLLQVARVAPIVVVLFAVLARLIL